MKFVSPTQISALGKAAIAAIFGFMGLMQIPQISAPIMQFGHYHPHFASIIAGITLVGTLLANPQVQTALHFEVPAGSVVDVKTPPAK